MATELSWKKRAVHNRNDLVLSFMNAGLTHLWNEKVEETCPKNVTRNLGTVFIIFIANIPVVSLGEYLVFRSDPRGECSGQVLPDVCGERLCPVNLD